MARVLFFLVLTLGAVAIIAMIAWNPEWWRPTLDAYGIEEDSQTFRALAKGLIAIVLGIPLTVLIYAIGHLGSNAGKTDIHGYTVLRLKAGTRYFLSVAALGLATMFFALPIIDPETKAPWAFQAGGLFFVFAAFAIFFAKIRFDQSTVWVTNNLGVLKQYAWADLTEIRDEPEQNQIRLVFRNGKKPTISYHYAGLGSLIETARSGLDVYAGTARSGDRQARA